MPHRIALVASLCAEVEFSIFWTTDYSSKFDTTRKNAKSVNVLYKVDRTYNNTVRSNKFPSDRRVKFDQIRQRRRRLRRAAEIWTSRRQYSTNLSNFNDNSTWELASLSLWRGLRRNLPKQSQSRRKIRNHLALMTNKRTATNSASTRRHLAFTLRGGWIHERRVDIEWNYADINRAIYLWIVTELFM